VFVKIEAVVLVAAVFLLFSTQRGVQQVVEFDLLATGSLNRIFHSSKAWMFS
jgi:hypothetical protein